MKCLVPEKWSCIPAKCGILGLLTIFLAFLTIFCLTSNTQVVFTHLYYIPIIIASFWFGRKGVLYATGLAAFYLCAVFMFSSPDTSLILAAAGRALFFIGVSLVIALLAIAIHRQHDQITASEEKFRGIWNSIQAGIILVDAETHTIIAANPEAVRMTGFTEEEMVGHVCHTFICPAEAGKCPISDLGMTIERAERVLLARGGERVPVFKTVTDMTIAGKRCFVETFVQIRQAENAS